MGNTAEAFNKVKQPPQYKSASSTTIGTEKTMTTVP